MIDYDYRIERDEGKGTEIYAPKNYPTKLPNLVLIEGPNSSGKTTLLNIIALGFHGLKADRLNPSLEAKLRDLRDSKHQRVQFSFKITGPDGKVVLSAERNGARNSDPVVREWENGKSHPLSPEAFRERYRLIYDVPDNPTYRLSQLVFEIRDFQKTYATKVGSLRAYIYHVIDEVKGSRDPKTLQRLRDEVAKNKKEISKLQEASSDLGIKIEKVERYRFARAYRESLGEMADLQAKLDALHKTREDVRKSAKKVDSKTRRQEGAVEFRLGNMKNSHRELLSLLKLLVPKEKEHLSVWERLDFDKAWEDYDFSESLTREMRYFRGVLDKMVKLDEKSMTEARVYTDLIEFLNRYRNAKVIIPGVEKSVEDFIELLEEFSKQYEHTQIVVENIRLAFTKLDELDENRRDALQLLADLKRMRSLQTGTDEELETTDESAGEKILQLAEKMDKIEAESKEYAGECYKRRIDEENLDEVIRDLEDDEALEPYMVYNHKQLGDLVEGWAEENQRCTNRVRQLELNNGVHENDIARLEKKKPHKYQDREEVLNALFRKCQFLEQRLSKDWDGYISTLAARGDPVKKAREEPEATKLTPEERRYFAVVAKFLGKKLGTIRHVEREYAVRSVDLLEGVVTTDEGRLIRLADMGTGQSQSAYLLSLLKRDDRRKIIALFDEVAMMDSASLAPIYRKLKELYEANQLLVGVVVQMANEPKVSSLLEIDSHA